MAASVADARTYLAPTQVDEIIFAVVPSDLTALPSLPVGPWIELPWRADVLVISGGVLAAEARQGRRVRLRVPAAQFASIEDAREALARLSEAGIASVIPDLEAWSVADTRRLLEVFLHDRRIVRPVDPFGWILSALARRRPLSLWDVLSPSEDRRVIDVRGGQREECLAAALRSRLRSGAAEQFFLDLPREQMTCLECRCFPVCQGYGEWVGGCETWKVVIDTLAAAASELRLSPGYSAKT